MSYVIQCGNGYVTRAKNNVPCVTSNKAQALVFDTEQKANNVMTTLPKLMREKGVQLLVIEDKDGSVNNQYTPVNMDSVKALICELSDQFKTMQGNKEWLTEMHSRVDQEISDILHYIEFYPFNACEGYKLAKELKTLRLKRRDIKNQLEAISIISNHTCNMLTDGRTNKALCSIETKQYAPRVLTELFEARQS